MSITLQDLVRDRHPLREAAASLPWARVAAQALERDHLAPAADVALFMSPRAFARMDASLEELAEVMRMELVNLSSQELGAILDQRGPGFLSATYRAMAGEVLRSRLQ